MRQALKQTPATPPPLTPAHQRLLRLLAEIMAEDYVAELREAEAKREYGDNAPLSGRRSRSGSSG